MGFKLAGYCMLFSALILSVSSTDVIADATEPFHPIGAPSVAPVVPAQPEVTVEPVAVVSEEPAATYAVREQVVEPIVLEPSRTLSLQRLRYEVYRFPDHDSVNRFAELATELPPLFGSE